MTEEQNIKELEKIAEEGIPEKKAEEEAARLLDEKLNDWNQPARTGIMEEAEKVEDIEVPGIGFLHLSRVMKKKRTLTMFAVTYIVFGAAFIYLMLMTPGLDFVQEQSQIYLMNNSGHVIHDIEVENSVGERIAFVETMVPQQKELLDVEGGGTITLSASAPYHATAQRSFTFTGEEGREVKFDYKLTVPRVVIVDINFDVEIELCNKGDELDALQIGKSHSALFFREGGSGKTIALGKAECESVVFTLTPLKVGKTKIYFNVKALSYSREIEKEITIEE